MQKKEETEKMLNRILEQLEQLHLLSSDDYYCYYADDYVGDKMCIKRVLRDLRSISTQKKEKFYGMSEFFATVYMTQNYNIKETLEYITEIGIEISDKQLRNILTKKGIYKGRGKNND